MHMKRRNRTSQGSMARFMAIVVGCALMIGSTYAWNELKLHKTNIFQRNNSRVPVVVLNDSFIPPSNWELQPDVLPESQQGWVDKRVSVTHQASGGNLSVFVRLSLKEFMQTQNTAGDFIIDEVTKEKLLFATFSEGSRVGQYLEAAELRNLPSDHPWQSLKPYEVPLAWDEETHEVTASKTYLLTNSTHIIDGIYGSPMLKPGELLGRWGTSDRANIEHGLQLTNECDYDPYLWDDKGILPEAGADMDTLAPIRDYVALKKPAANQVTFMTLKEWAALPEEKRRFNSSIHAVPEAWIIDEEDGWVYWNRPLEAGSTTKNLIEGVRLRQTPLPFDELGQELGSLEYYIHVDLNAIDGKYEPLLEGESSHESEINNAGEAPSIRHFYDNPQEQTLADQRDEKKLFLKEILNFVEEQNPSPPSPPDPPTPDEDETPGEGDQKTLSSSTGVTDPNASSSSTNNTNASSSSGTNDPNASSSSNTNNTNASSSGGNTPPASSSSGTNNPNGSSSETSDPNASSSSETESSSSQAVRTPRLTSNPPTDVSNPSNSLNSETTTSTASAPANTTSQPTTNRGNQPDVGLGNLNGANTDQASSNGSVTSEGAPYSDAPRPDDTDDGETLVRRLAMATIPVEIIWELPEDKTSKKPDAVELKLDHNGQTVQVQQVQENVAGKWETMFVAPKYDEEGNIIDYNVQQKPIKYFTSSISDTQGGVKIKSSYFDDEGNPFGGVRVDNLVPSDIITLEGNVLWDHGENEKYPDRQPVDSLIQVRTPSGDVVQTVEVTASNDWKYSVKVPRYDGTGAEIPYTLTQWEIPNYAQEPEGYDILNIFEGDGRTPIMTTKKSRGWIPITLTITGLILLIGGGLVLFLRRKQKREIEALLKESESN